MNTVRLVSHILLKFLRGLSYEMSLIHVSFKVLQPADIDHTSVTLSLARAECLMRWAAVKAKAGFKGTNNPFPKVRQYLRDI